MSKSQKSNGMNGMNGMNEKSNDRGISFDNSKRSGSNLANSPKSDTSTIPLVPHNDHTHIKRFIQRYLLLILVLLQLQSIIMIDGLETITKDEANKAKNTYLFMLYVNILNWIDTQIVMTWRSPFGRSSNKIGFCSSNLNAEREHYETFSPIQEGKGRGSGSKSDYKSLSSTKHQEGIEKGKVPVDKYKYFSRLSNSSSNGMNETSQNKFGNVTKSEYLSLSSPEKKEEKEKAPVNKYKYFSRLSNSSSNNNTQNNNLDLMRLNDNMKSKKNSSHSSHSYKSDDIYPRKGAIRNPKISDWKKVVDQGHFLSGKLIWIVILLLGAFQNSGLSESLPTKTNTTTYQTYKKDLDSNYNKIEQVIRGTSAEIDRTSRTSRMSNNNNGDESVLRRPISSSTVQIFDNTQFWNTDESTILGEYLSNSSKEMINYITNTHHPLAEEAEELDKLIEVQNGESNTLSAGTRNSTRNSLKVKGFENEQVTGNTQTLSIGSFNPMNTIDSLFKGFKQNKPDPVLKKAIIQSTGICAPISKGRASCLDKEGKKLLSKLLEDLHKFEPTFDLSEVRSKCSEKHLNGNRQNACLLNATNGFKPINVMDEIISKINPFNPVRPSVSTAIKKIVSESMNDRVYKYYLKLNSYLSWLLQYEPGWEEREEISGPRDILKSQFRPTRPHEDFHNEGGLYSGEIQSVLTQYERVYDDFVLFPEYRMKAMKKSYRHEQVEIGDNSAIHQLNVADLLAQGKSQIGIPIIWDFGENDIPTSRHAGAIYINIDINDKRFGFYHHESNAVLGKTSGISKLHRNIQYQLRTIYKNRRLDFPLEFNESKKQVQKENKVTGAKADGECGVYSIYFIVASLEAGKNKEMETVYDSIHVNARDAMIVHRKKNFFREIMA